MQFDSWRVLTLQVLVCVSPAITFLSCGSRASAQQAFFMGLGDLPGSTFNSQASDVSGDGSVVIGYSNYGHNGLFRWTRETGVTELVSQVDLGVNEWSKPRISDDGSAIVAKDSTGFFQWRETTGKVPLLSNSSSWIAGISAEGGKIALSNQVWTESGGLSPSPYGGAIRGISADGLTFIGYQGPLAPPNNSGFTWSATRGVTELGPTLADGTILYNPLAISGDGKVVVGSGSDGSGNYKGWFRWREDAGLEGYKSPDGFDFGSSSPHALSYDGSVIVGGGTGAAWIWRDTIEGTKWLSDVLGTELGLGTALAGWRLGSATAISIDGRTIVGYGLNPANHTEAWIAYLGNPVPEPDPLALFVVAVLAASLLRRPSPVPRSEFPWAISAVGQLPAPASQAGASSAKSFAAGGSLAGAMEHFRPAPRPALNGSHERSLQSLYRPANQSAFTPTNHVASATPLSQIGGLKGPALRLAAIDQAMHRLGESLPTLAAALFSRVRS